jgi:hypothetical protein
MLDLIWIDDESDVIDSCVCVFFSEVIIFVSTVKNVLV